MSISTKHLAEATLSEKQLNPGQYRIIQSLHQQPETEYFCGQYLPPGEQYPRDVVLYRVDRSEHELFNPLCSFLEKLNSNKKSCPYHVKPLAIDGKNNTFILENFNPNNTMYSLLWDVTRKKLKPPNYILVRILLDVAKGISQELQGEPIPVIPVIKKKKAPGHNPKVDDIYTHRTFYLTNTLVLSKKIELDEQEKIRFNQLSMKENHGFDELVKIDLINPNIPLARTAEGILLEQARTQTATKAAWYPPEGRDANSEQSNAFRFGVLAWQIWYLQLFNEYKENNINRVVNLRLLPVGNEVDAEAVKKRFYSDHEAITDLIDNCLNKHLERWPNFEKICNILETQYRLLRDDYIKQNGLQNELQKLQSLNSKKMQEESKNAGEKAGEEGSVVFIPGGPSITPALEKVKVLSAINEPTEKPSLKKEFPKKAVIFQMASAIPSQAQLPQIEIEGALDCEEEEQPGMPKKKN